MDATPTPPIVPIRQHVSAQDQPATSDAAPYEPLIGVRDLATWIGVSEHTVKKWCTKGPESGLVPRMLRVNGQFRFRPSDVRDWLTSKELR